jgi:uncharacterized protein
MRWQGGRRSGNIQDRRGGGPVVAGGIGAVIIGLIALVLGVDPAELTTAAGPTADVQTSAPGEYTGVDEQADFVAVVLADTEDTWNDLFARSGLRYEEPELVLFNDVVRSACGTANSAVGPFYCPADRRVYLDLSFFRDLDQRFGAPGELARAYVVAHEVGHHVQTITGVSERVRAAQSRASQREANALQVRMELQADCYAGVWAASVDRRGLLEHGDLEEGLGAAAAVGDDRLAGRAGRIPQQETFTHGTSEQRMGWFRTGFETGDPDACDTFAAR